MVLSYILVPSIFEPILRLVRPLMSASTREALRTFGYDRAEYSNYILQSVEGDNLPHRFGGTKKSANSIKN